MSYLLQDAYITPLSFTVAFAYFSIHIGSSGIHRIIPTRNAFHRRVAATDPLGFPVPDGRRRYYDITSTWVDWTSMIFMILYIPLIFPASWILDKLVI